RRVPDPVRPRCARGLAPVPAFGRAGIRRGDRVDVPLRRAPRADRTRRRDGRGPRVRVPAAGDVRRGKVRHVERARPRLSVRLHPCRGRGLARGGAGGRGAGHVPRGAGRHPRQRRRGGPVGVVRVLRARHLPRRAGRGRVRDRHAALRPRRAHRRRRHVRHRRAPSHPRPHLCAGGDAGRWARGAARAPRRRGRGRDAAPHAVPDKVTFRRPAGPRRHEEAHARGPRPRLAAGVRGRRQVRRRDGRPADGPPRHRSRRPHLAQGGRAGQAAGDALRQDRRRQGRLPPAGGDRPGDRRRARAARRQVARAGRPRYISRVPLSVFSTATQAWFDSAFASATPIQAAGFAPIARGEHTILCAPTGSGKTLAAFLWALDRQGKLRASAEPGFRVVYVSPLKALAYAVQRRPPANAAGPHRAAPPAAPSAGAAELGAPSRPPRVSIRTGDTSARERRAMGREPGQILITTPESFYLLLGSRARETLRTVDTVIVDEIHVLAPGKRGAHLALSLERLVDLAGREPQRIGLSATQNPLADVAHFLGRHRPGTIVAASAEPRLDLTMEVPARMEGDAPAGEGGAWIGIHHRLVELVRAHRSTIVFANSRRLTERLAGRLNEIAGEPLVRAHHGSLAREKRQEIEEALKAGVLRGIVATSSLELGIDMGAVDFVAQIESPGAVSRALQRVGRAGHGVGRRSRATIFPKFRGDLLEATVVAERMLAGRIEETRVPRNPLDVLAQQVVAMTGDRAWRVDDLLAAVRRAAPYATLSRELLVAVLDMLAGKYPSDDFAELRPRVVWDRPADVVAARRDAKLLAIVNGGTIPDRGLYGVYLGEDGPRVGELDEEMVHESRVGQTFLLGASTWRIIDITRDRVIVAPAPGEPGRMPFWRGEGL